MANKLALVFYCLFLMQIAGAQPEPPYALMPWPDSVASNFNKIAIDSNFRIAVEGNPHHRLFGAASRFLRRLSNATGVFLDKQGYVSAKDKLPHATLLLKVNRPGKLVLGEDESYRLETRERNIIISAATDLGAIHGLETLLQLLQSDNGNYFFPGVYIADSPRFAWRGLLLDVALHFMPVENIKRTLDGMALVKMNVLHLHLCNDQGFRVQSKQFPRLQQVASDGFYYTQEEITNIIQYANERGIRVVPEFVVPAHTTAILTAYPDLASVKRDYQLQRYFGVFDPVLDPTNEKVYPFLEKLFKEMAGLFPDTYFHIGGDENTGKDWENTPHIKSFMKARGMKTPMDLQTYFNQRLLPIIRKQGKIMIGWDEVFQPGLPKEIVVQSWRGNEAYYNSIRKGHQAILSYGYYIDLIQPAAYHYDNDPLPDSVRFSEAEKKRILGGEATMWSELVTPLTVDSRIWPRTAAIAERLWSPKSVNNTSNMYLRLQQVSLQLEAVGLTHLSYKEPLMRFMTKGYNTKALAVLAAVLEPLKIYERNQGDTLYSVFSPFTKIADLATPDQEVPRLFKEQVSAYLRKPDANLENAIRNWLLLWKNNDAELIPVFKQTPLLDEAVMLSKNLSLLGATGLESLQYINENRNPGAAWMQDKLGLLQQARQQSGRCELQIVDPIQQLVERAGTIQ